MTKPRELAIVQQALAAYDLPTSIRIETATQGINNRSFLLQSSETTLRCKVYTPIHPVEALQYEYHLLLQLSNRGCSFAVPTPLPARDGTTLQPTPLGWLAVLPNLPGALVNPAERHDVVALGTALGELHAVLARLPQTPRPGHALFNAFFNFPPPACNPRHLQPALLSVSATREAAELCTWWRDQVALLEAYHRTTYAQLPMQLCHNDVAPYNVLVADGQVCAFLDFEFAGLAPRAFDLAMALRMTMRVWENPNPWETLTDFCEGYRQAGATLSVAECCALPMLIRLRSAMGILWALGRNTPFDGQRMLQHLKYLRNAVRWLEQHGDQLVEVVTVHLAN